MSKALDGINLRDLIDEAELLIEQTEHGDEAPPIDNKDEANRRLWSLRYRQQELQEIDDAFDAEIAQLKARQADMTSGLRSSISWLEQQLEGWHRLQKKADPMRTTIKMPAGATRLSDGRVGIAAFDDVDAVAVELLEALSHRGLDLAVVVSEVPATHKVNRAKLLPLVDHNGKHDDRPLVAGDDGESVIVRATGEVLQGVKLVKGDDSFTVRL